MEISVSYKHTSINQIKIKPVNGLIDQPGFKIKQKHGIYGHKELEIRPNGWP
jgi:hypothetical protein